MSVERIELLIVVIAAVAILARRLRLPYTVGLLFAGLGLGLMPGNEHLRLTRELIASFLGPPLVFESALNIRWSRFKGELPFAIALATLGFSVAAILVGLGMHFLVGWPLGASAVFAVLIAATDPISVIAAFRDSGSDGRARLLIESESMLNDGGAAVAFSIAVTFALGGHIELHQAVWQFALSSLGGIAIGAVVGGIGLLTVGRTAEHITEIVITVATAYGAFLAAEHFHLSGILATLAAGIVVANSGMERWFTSVGRESVTSFWEFAAFAADSIIFLLIGVRAARIPAPEYLVPIVIAIALVLLGRAVSVYGVGALFSKTRWRLGLGGQTLMFWAGLRGALALALALSVPQDVPYAAAIDEVTLGVVVFSAVFQGISLKPIMVRIDLAEH